MRKLVLIDGKSVFYRGYYAMGALSLKDGTPTGGVYGFAAIAMEIVKKLEPTKVVVAWDSRTSVSQRRAIYPEYKAGRVKPGEDFYTQIPLLKELILDLGWNFVEIENYEADDIIGTLSLQADEAGDFETYIISSDLDMLQIVDENTHMWRILKGFSNIEQIDIPELEVKYGIKKDQFLDLKALKGDASDNIPGVSGIGEKTAAKLLNTYGSLDGVYEHIMEISGAMRTKLENGKESAYMSQKLAKIMFDAPVKLNELKDFEFNKNQVILGLKKLEFNSLIRKIEKVDDFSEVQEDGAKDFSGTKEDSAKNFSDVQENDAKNFSDTKKDSMKDFSEAREENRDEMNIEVPDDLIIALDIKSLMHADPETAEKILGGGKYWDVAQAAFLLDPLMRELPPLLDLKAEYKKQVQEFQKFPKLYKVYTELDSPLIPVLYKMEKKGMLIDREYFANLKAEYEKEVEELTREIYEMSGAEFNLNSPVQMSEILFGRLGLPTKGIKKTTRGYSTGAKELEKLEMEHPVISKIIKYREASKLLGTYITPMPEIADAEGRIHTTFTQNVTATGRLSSKDPNLQNIPVRTEEGKRIRTGFVPPEGKVLVSADYSQFELRLAAVLSGDAELIRDFNADLDIHTKTAAEAFNIPVPEVTKTQRRAAKAINFGIIYGMSVNGLTEATGMNFAEAKKFMDNYYALRAPVMEQMKATLEKARTEGYVETFYGRRRPTPDVLSSNFVIRQAAERAAQNMPIQGTEADLMKRAMIKVSQRLPEGAEMVMQVHDSLIVECDVAQADKVVEVLKQEMEGVAPELTIKLAVEVTMGKNWGEL